MATPSDESDVRVVRDSHAEDALRNLAVVLLSGLSLLPANFASGDG
jgi:hypothetical protein